MRGPERKVRKATPATPGPLETPEPPGWTGARDAREPSVCGVLKGGLERRGRRDRREKWEFLTTDLRETRDGQGSKESRADWSTKIQNLWTLLVLKVTWDLWGSGETPASTDIQARRERKVCLAVTDWTEVRERRDSQVNQDQG